MHRKAVEVVAMGVALVATTAWEAWALADAQGILEIGLTLAVYGSVCGWFVVTVLADPLDEGQPPPGRNSPAARAAWLVAAFSVATLTLVVLAWLMRLLYLLYGVSSWPSWMNVSIRLFNMLVSSSAAVGSVSHALVLSGRFEYREGVLRRRSPSGDDR